jgi:hypothetical protein
MKKTYREMVEQYITKIGDWIIFGAMKNSALKLYHQ